MTDKDDYIRRLESLRDLYTANEPALRHALECMERIQFINGEYKNISRVLEPEARDRALALGYPEDVVDNTEEMVRDSAKIIPLSRYEDPRCYFVTQTLQLEIADALPIAFDNAALKKLPIFGTLNTGRVNASAFKITTDQFYLIFFESGLYGFANLLAKISAYIHVSEINDKSFKLLLNDQDIIKKLAEKNIINRLRELIEAYVVMGDPHAAPQYFIEFPYLHTADRIREAMEIFVLGHEYGHCMLEHLETNMGFAEARDKSLREQCPDISSDWGMEFEADMVGLEILLASAYRREEPLDLYYGSVKLFFAGVRAIEKAVSIMKFGETRLDVSDTHPPTETRDSMLSQYLSQQLGDAEAFNQCEEYGRAMASALDNAWEIIAPHFYEMHAQGVAAHPMWNRSTPLD